MIEIPESITIAGQLNGSVKGKRIVQAEAGHTPHGFAFYTGDADFYSEAMEGKVIGRSAGIGSMVEIGLDYAGGETGPGYSFVIGDGTNIRYFPPGEKLPSRYQARLALEDGSSLVCTVQMYGSMSLVETDTYDNFYYRIAKEKPMPGSEGFDYGYFCSLKEGLSGNLSVKAFLATDQRIPGLGNGVLQDILFLAGLHPKRKTGTLGEMQWKKLYETTVEVLGRMTAAGGRNTEKTLFGEKGGYQTILCRLTAGKPCPYCGNGIQKASYLGGTVYFCPECQACPVP